MIKKYQLVSLIIFILLLLAAFTARYALINIAPYGIIKPFRSLNAPAAEYLHKNYTQFDVTTKDSITLKGFLIKGKGHTKYLGTVIILHGIGANKESQIPLAEYFASFGFNAIIFDLRAHGESGGKFCTFGYYEKYDIMQIIDKIQSDLPDAGPVGIMGSSLGGAIAMQALAIDKRIKCGVIVSTFSSLDEVVFDYTKRMLHIPFRFASDIALKEAGRLANFNPDDVKPFEFAKRIEQPVLYVHGSNDGNINLNNARKNYDNTKSANKLLYIIPNAHHNDVNEIGGADYKAYVLHFFNTFGSHVIVVADSSDIDPDIIPTVEELKR
jgi:uncharacterized protein